MLFSRRLSSARLAEYSRSLRVGLSSGLMLSDAVARMAKRGSPELRPISAQMAAELKAGASFRDALEPHAGAFPPLFLAMVDVGEETGNLAEVMHELEKYFEMQARLRRQFLASLAKPALQLGAAIFIVAGLIFILGLLPSGTNGRPAIDPLGFGLVGPTGAAVFLAGVFGAMALAVGGVVLARRATHRQVAFDRFLLRLPAIGGCVQALCLTRFCVALRMILDGGAPIRKTFRLAFLATDNAAFMAAADTTEASLKRGETVFDSLAHCDLFPEEFLSTVNVGEESGQLPEVLKRQGEHYDEIAGQRLALLTQLAGFAVWLGVAMLIVAAIIRIFVVVYLGSIEQHLK